ncbi:amino acid adenylation domain-containing protein [Streptomyces populi]|uniref:amino acid adenylation domain-containing protein n=1 Tax=Streptomyces populi TaxID=2058924 RepID=UPI0013A70991|nr:amino acid adenylation domain-containing protein [Streptomyces populi]
MPLPALLQDLIDNAELRPSSPALSASDGELSYAEFHAEVRRVARWLVANGVEPGQRVGFTAHKTAASVVAMFAVMRAGAAYVPLDPRAPTARLAGLVEDARCPVVLTSTARDEELAKALRAKGATVPADLRTMPAVAGDAELPTEIAESSVALCLYTSGSTGRPKGVQLSYAAVHAFHAGFNELSKMGPDSRCLNVAALHFDVSLFDVLLPLRLGAVVHIGPAIPTPEVTLGIVTEHRITHMSSVGSTMTLLADESKDFSGYDLSTLTALLTGAEIIDPRTVQRWLAAAPNLVVINAYGPCEATCAVINHCISEREPDRTEFYPIGTPLPGTRIRFRDEDGRVDEDGPGEILIAGDQLMVGYLNRPGEEERAFLEQGGTRYYRTGDWGSRRPDGVILFDGRRDDEVKVRGHRVNLNEIRRGLETSPDVHRAFVAAVRAPSGTQLLACAVARTQVERMTAGAADGRPLATLPADQEQSLRRHLGAVLPGYMVPDLFYVLPGLPVLPSGKPDATAVRRWITASGVENA